ncbi:uncharacterized protein LOC106660841 isoform X2 [Cimex lectularius]|uniref:Uncharacterized protein n=1 Tax=Cimex lectularius TaxID=79782 RepID=A0A8I6R8P8_CIMLE|nr:uncharacterized protein LOC106660841 isoform X2 [Cimex lectularius]
MAILSKKKNVGTKKLAVSKKASKSEDVKERTLAQWWHHFNNDNITILPGGFPKVHHSVKSRKRSFDEAGYRLIVRPQFQVYKIQHPDDVLNSTKKKDLQSKKSVKNYPIHPNNHNDHTDFFKHHLSTGEQLKQYREMNAYSRTRLGKVNKKQLHKAAMMIFRVRMESEGRKPPPTAVTVVKLQEEEPKPKPSVISIPKVKSKVKAPVKKLALTKFTKPTARMSRDVIFNKKKDSVMVDGFRTPKAESSENDKRSISKSEKESTETGDTKTSMRDSDTDTSKSVNQRTSNVSSNVSRTSASSILSTPKRPSRNLSAVSRLQKKTVIRPVSNKQEINKCTVNFPEGENSKNEKQKKGLKFSTFGLLPSRPSFAQSLLRGEPSKRSLIIGNLPSRTTIADSFKQQIIDKKLKDSLENENFLIVRPVQERTFGSQVRPGLFRLAEGDELRIDSTRLLEKHGLPKLEPKFKYSEKYPAKANYSKFVTRKRSKQCLLKRETKSELSRARSKHFLRFGKSISAKSKLEKGDKGQLENIEAALNEARQKNNLDQKRENLLSKIEDQAKKGKNNRALNEYLTEKSSKLNEEINEITKRINVKTKGVDLSELSRRILEKYS